MSFTSTYIAGAVGAGDTDRYCETQNMKVGALTLTATRTPGNGARKVTCTRTVDGDADTPGTLLVTARTSPGQTITETLIPGAHTVLVTGTKYFSSITSVVGAGWVIDGNNDTIVVGMAAEHLVVRDTGRPQGHPDHGRRGVGSITVSDGTKTLMILPANMAIGYYEFNLSYTAAPCRAAGRDRRSASSTRQASPPATRELTDARLRLSGRVQELHAGAGRDVARFQQRRHDAVRP